MAANNFEIKMLKQEHIKGPLPKAIGTAGSAVKFDFFFTFSPQLNQQNDPKESTTAPLPQNQKG
jgi:hypothetical protein